MKDCTKIKKVSGRNRWNYGKLWLVLMFVGLSVSVGWGQSIWTNTITGTNPNTSNPYTVGDVKDANITVSGIGRGSGISGTNANNRYNATAWSTSALDANDYFYFTITPSAGFKINLTSFVYTGQVSSGTPTVAFRSSLDSYTSNIGTATVTGSTISLSGASYQGITTAITFRYYAYGLAAAGTTLSINDFTFNGTVEPLVSSYTVSYNSNGGSGSMSDASSPYTSGSSVTVKSNEFTRTGYTFASWNTSSNGSGTSYSPDATFNIAANTTLYAQWSANNNTISFDGNGNTGGSMSNQTIATDASANLTSNVFSKTGYSFAGWATTAGGAVAFANGASYTMGTGNVTLYAKWTANNNTITFDGNGSDGGSMSDQTIATDATANLTTNLFTRTGYTFNGWNTASNGSGTSYANGASYTMGTSNVTLYAQWLIISTPTINVTGSLSAVSTTYGTASSSTTFTVSGSALTEDILVTAPAGFEVSKTVGGESGYATTQTLTHSDGTISSTTIYVRLAATTSPASYSGNVVMSSSGATSQNAATVLSTVSPKQLNVSGLSITTEKVYDGTTSAAVTGTPSLLASIASGSSISNDGKPITGDEVSLSGSASGVYNSKDVSTATTVTVTGLSLSGAQSANYTLNQGSAAATISVKNLTMSGLSVPASKAYDGTTTAIVSGTATLQSAEVPGAGTTDDGKPYTGDVVSISGTATGTYNDANVVNATTVTFAGLSLTGAQASNYSITIQSPQAATITKANQTISLAATDTKFDSDVNYTLAATSATSGVNALSFSSSNTSVATINASTGLVDIIGVGETTFTVSQPGNDNYNAATNATQVLTVTEPEPLVNFDNAGNWTAGSAQITSYAANHTFIQNNWTFTGGNALRNTTTAQDGYAGALGTYSWRLKDEAGVSWTASYNVQLATNKKFTGFGFDARRWDGSPSPAFTVEYSLNGGTSWNTATSIGTSGVIDNAALSNASNWVTFNQTVSSNTGLAANNFVIRVKSTGTTERIMIDNFTYQITTLPLFSGTGNWTSTQNWNTGSVPASDAQVIIDGIATVNSSVTIGSMTINSGKSVTVNSDNNLTVSNVLTNNGTINLNSGVTGTATLKATTSGTGTYNIEQYLPSARNWYIASPIDGAAAPATGITRYYEYIEAGDNNVSSNTDQTGATLFWKGYTPASLNMVKGKGYIAQASAPTTISFNGAALNNADVTVDLIKTGTASKSGFNLIGNPFPAYLNVMSAIQGNASLTKTVWYRTRSTGASPLYKHETVNTASGEGSDVAGHGSNVTGYIPPMQAFWVRTNANTTLTLSKASTSHALSGAVNTTLLRAPSVDTKRLRLKISNGLTSDETLLYFNPDAQNGLDDYDSPKMFENSASVPEIYTAEGAENLALNGKNSYDYGTSIPLGLKIGETNTYTIAASQVQNFDGDTKIVLVDNNTSTQTDLTAGESYTFTSDATTSTSRFNVLFKSATGTTGLKGVSDDMNIYASDTRILIDYFNVNATNASVSVYNGVGQKLHEQYLTGNKTIINKNFTSGVYVVKVDNGTGEITKKVIVQ